MRWFNVLLSAGVVLGAPWIAEGQSGSGDSGTLGNPMTDVRVTPVTMTAVRPLEIEGTHASPIPEPSAGFAIALLGTAFLIRRRRPRLH